MLRAAPRVKLVAAVNDDSTTRQRVPYVPYAPRLTKVQACMERYVSTIIVRGMIEKTLADRGLSWGTVPDSAVPNLVEDSMVGLRLFVDAPRLPALMLELAELLEE
jgi:hypothetical protein